MFPHESPLVMIMDHYHKDKDKMSCRGSVLIRFCEGFPTNKNEFQPPQFSIPLLTNMQYWVRCFLVRNAVSFAELSNKHARKGCDNLLFVGSWFLHKNKYMVPSLEYLHYTLYIAKSPEDQDTFQESYDTVLVGHPLNNILGGKISCFISGYCDSRWNIIPF